MYMYINIYLRTHTHILYVYIYRCLLTNETMIRWQRLLYICVFNVHVKDIYCSNRNADAYRETYVYIYIYMYVYIYIYMYTCIGAYKAKDHPMAASRESTLYLFF